MTLDHMPGQAPHPRLVSVGGEKPKLSKLGLKGGKGGLGGYRKSWGKGVICSKYSA